MSLSLAVDNRVVDEAYAARFLGRLVTLLAEPQVLL
jgi:pyruvate/2-oxoglutarate dehydrogenase complex dihydrolipoamide acyltransferase (E2) component